jgi:glutamate carboxypeptidase
MKGGLVIGVAALEAIARTNVAPDLVWAFLLNSDEETGSYHSEGAIAAEASSGHYAHGLALEPATPEGGLVVERAGSGQFLIEVVGRSAHVGRDFASGVSAVNALAHMIVDIEKMVDPARGIIMNLGPIQGGHATNVVPDLARAWGNVRFKHAADADAIARALNDVAARHTVPSGLPQVRVRTSFIRAAKPLTPGTQALAEAARKVADDLGQQLPFTKTAGVCDGNIMQASGLPTIDTVGVRGGGLHTPQEWIELASLVERCQMLAVLVMRLSRMARSG